MLSNGILLSYFLNHSLHTVYSRIPVKENVSSPHYILEVFSLSYRVKRLSSHLYLNYSKSTAVEKPTYPLIMGPYGGTPCIFLSIHWITRY